VAYAYRTPFPTSTPSELNGGEEAILIGMRVGENFRHFQARAQRGAGFTPRQRTISGIALLRRTRHTTGAQQGAATDPRLHRQTLHPAFEIDAAIGLFRMFFANFDHELFEFPQLPNTPVDK